VVFGRAFFFKKDVGKSILERVIVIGAVVMAGAWATVDIYFGLTQGISVLVSFDYLIGAFIGVIVFIYLARKAV
jgi:ABC-type enterochelin transport system permease subunit